MSKLTGSTTGLVAGGLLALAVGLGSLSLAPGDVGSTLVLGGVLLLISTAGIEVYDPDQEDGRDGRDGQSGRDGREGRGGQGGQTGA